MGGGANYCEPVVPPTEKAKGYRTQLMVLGFVHLALSILLMFISPMLGIYELIDVMILFCALAQMNFCCLIIYIINITINFFRYFDLIGLAAQRGSIDDIINEGSANDVFSFVVICLLTVFYVIAVIMCFYAYREFKGMMFDHGMGGGFGMGGMSRPAGGAQAQAQGAGQAQA